MAIRTIIEEGDDTLRKASRPVEKFDKKLWNLLDDMADTMYQANGVGLAAVQVGILRRAVVIDVGEGLLELINPRIIKADGEQEGMEGCLSYPGQFGIVVRPNYVKVQAQDRDGRTYTVEGEGLLARAFCHEIDHLDGSVFKDIVIRMLDPDELDED